jgi:hypothetical protein
MNNVRVTTTSGENVKITNSENVNAPVAAKK